jgi:hypothetical protein
VARAPARDGHLEVREARALRLGEGAHARRYAREQRALLCRQRVVRALQRRAVEHERLARAMATIAPVDDFAALPELIAKRDELLALA